MVCLMLALSLLIQDAPKESTSTKRERLTRTISDLHAAGEFADAISPTEELVALNKSDGRAVLGLAGLLAQTGRSDDALKQLDRAIKLHAVHPDMMEHDPDFAELRENPRFAKLLDAARADLDAQRAKAQATWSLKLPSKYDKWNSAPLIVALHGYGSSKDDMQRLWSRVADEFGAILLTPEGRFQGPGGGRSWGIGGRESPARDVMAAVNDTKRRLRIDPARVVLTGFSQGGGMTYAIGLLYPKTFRALIPMAGPFTYQDDPAFKSDPLKALRVYIIVGADDPNAGMNKHAAPLFQDAGAAVKLNVFPRLGHAVPPNSDEVLREALRFVLASHT